jgi:hypothetical protein
MPIQKHQLVTTGDLGKGLRINPATKLADAFTSTDANNAILFGTDNGLKVDISSKFNNPTGTASQYIAGDGTIADFPVTMNATLSDLTGTQYYYFGGLLSSGAWQVNRWDISTNTKAVASEINNSNKTTLSAAWSAKTTLTFI